MEVISHPKNCLAVHILAFQYILDFLEAPPSVSDGLRQYFLQEADKPLSCYSFDIIRGLILQIFPPDFSGLKAVGRAYINITKMEIKIRYYSWCNIHFFT